MTSEVTERSFHVEGKADLTLSNISGSVVIQPGEPGTIDIKATKHTNGANASRTKVELSQSEDGKVTAATRFEDGILGFLSFASPCDVDYEVRIPRECAVQVSGVSSELKADGLQGDLKFSTVSGDLTIESLAGEISISAVSGDIHGQGIDGKLHLKTVSGDIALKGVVAANVDASTVSGEIHLQAELTGGPYTLKSVSGNAHLELPEGAACRAEHRSISGSIRTPSTNAKHSKSPGVQTVEIGSGGPLITSNSISGDLWINLEGNPGQNETESATPESAAAPQEPSAKTADNHLGTEERMAVLEKISKGELSVEEGLHTLNSK